MQSQTSNYKRNRRWAKIFLAAISLLCLLTGYTYVVVRQDSRNRDLIAAIKSRNVTQVERLLEAGADANARDIPAEDPHHLSYWLRRLWRKPASAHLPTALVIALSIGPDTLYAVDRAMYGPDARDTAIARLLIEHGADVNATDAYGNSPLMLAAFYDPGANTTRLLLDHGADINYQGPKGFSALVEAADHAPPEVINLLLDRGARVNPGQSVLAAIIARGTYGIPQTDIDAGLDFYPLVLRLLQMGADVHVRCGYGRTLLHLAAQVQDIRFLRLMLARGLNVNAVDEDGVTALMMAAYHPTEANFDLLLSAGANIKIRDKQGQTVLNHAYECDNHNDNQYVIQKLWQLGVKTY